MPTATQTASIPGEFLDLVTRWAQRQPAPVSVILFGSRARGDHRPESDWDIALVHEGGCPSLEELPRELDGARIEWVARERSRAMSRLNVCGLAHAIAASGRCLFGDPLPIPGRKDANARDAWRFLALGHREMCTSLNCLAYHWELPDRLRLGGSLTAAEKGQLAGERLCKAALSIRAVEPKRSHSVAELCEDLEREFPADPLLPVLRACDVTAGKAPGSAEARWGGPREGIDVSATRLVRVLQASAKVLAAACEHPPDDDCRCWVEVLADYRDLMFDSLRRMERTDCPPATLQAIATGLKSGPSTSELWDRLPRAALRRRPRGMAPKGR